MNRTRALLYAVLALAVPLPALALDRGDSAGSLDVQASLGGCGVGEAAISCRIDVAFSRVADAEYYTASVTAPGGSVLELGTVASGGEGGASTSATVPFSGNGVYTVTVSAWGYDDRGRPDVVESERAGTDRGAVRQRAGKTEVAAPLQPPPPEEQPPPSAEPPVPPGVEQPECPTPSDEAEPEPAEPAPAGEAEPDAEGDPAATADSECEPPQQPVPEPVP